MLFLDLPTEIFATILQALPYGDILSCREACKSLRRIVDRSTAVQYSLELGASGKLDNALCAGSNADKLAELRRVNRSWAQFKWKHRVGPIPVRNFASVYEFTGGCFFQDINASFRDIHDSPPCSISWLPFPHSKGVGVHEWGHSEFAFRPADICVDANRDLMVVLERKEESDGRTKTMSCIAHFRTVSTNDSHPHAAAPTICICSTTDSTLMEHGMIVQLGGDHIGLLLSRREIEFRRRDNFHVWDWTNGVRKADVLSNPGSRWDSFCFLANDAILLPDTGVEEMNIYFLAPEPDSFKLEASLQLPETKMKHAIHYMSVRCEPVARSPIFSYPSRKVPGSRHTPFRTDPQGAIVIVALDYALPVESESLETGGFFISLPEHQVFAVKRLKLLDLAREARSRHSEFISTLNETYDQPQSSIPSITVSDTQNPRLHAQEWIHHTRWGLSHVPPRWICYTHGSRYISMPDRPWGSRKNMSIKIYDFNIMDEKKAECMGQDFVSDSAASSQAEAWMDGCDEEEDEEVEYIPNEYGAPTKVSTPAKWPVRSVVTLLGPSKVHKPLLFKESFKTCLPCRVIETEAVFDWDSVVIDEEHVIGLKEEHPENGILESIDVLVF